jgi:hypothetical protein
LSGGRHCKLGNVARPLGRRSKITQAIVIDALESAAFAMAS